jgi:hypothetical protein
MGMAVDWGVFDGARVAVGGSVGRGVGVKVAVGGRAVGVRVGGGTVGEGVGTTVAGTHPAQNRKRVRIKGRGFINFS